MTKRHFSRTIRQMALGVVVTGALAITGCSLEDLVKSELPPTTLDPDVLKNEEGALGLYNGVIWAFRRGFGGSSSYVWVTGRMTDELSTGAYVEPGVTLPLAKNTLAEVDSRTMPEDEIYRSAYIENWYRELNKARTQAVDAIHHLKSYAPALPQDLIGHMYAMRGLSMVLLAEVFCSGIPLSEIKSPGGMEYKPGSTTEAVYTAALAYFDTALAFVPDSARFRDLAKVGKARALINLGRLGEAADLVRDVPTDFEYRALYSESSNNNFMYNARDTSDPENGFGTVGDREGINGLPFASSNDPRVPVVPAPRQSSNYPLTTYVVPAKLVPSSAPWNGLSTKARYSEDIMIASGIEARLIEAEALAANNDAAFLTILNRLRTTCDDAASCPEPAPAGEGGVAGLPPLTDPGNMKDRLKLVFDERGYWLFLTGQRQGALRRMVRVHGFAQNEVYPTGFFPYGGQYGGFTNLPIPYSEQRINPKYKGCFNRDA